MLNIAEGEAEEEATVAVLVPAWEKKAMLAHCFKVEAAGRPPPHLHFKITFSLPPLPPAHSAALTCGDGTP